MNKILLEGGIFVLLVLIGISIFIPSSDGSVNDVIVEFEEDVNNGEVVEDGELDDVYVKYEDKSNLIARINSKIANVLVNGLNSIFELGMKVIRKIIN